MDQQYDMPPREMRMFQEKERQRAALREYYLKHTTSPYPEMKMAQDQAIVRYHAMLEYKHEFMKLNGKNVKYLTLALALPMALLYYGFGHIQSTNEHLFRTGKVAYKDREWKTIL